MAERERITTLIKTTYPFHKLDDALVNLVVDNLESVTVKKGQRIYREGFPSDMDNLCIILEGKVRLVQTKRGETQTVMVLGEGEMFGHEMLESNHKHPVSSFAESDLVLLQLNRVKANLLVEKIPTFADALRILLDSYMILLKNRFSWKGTDEAIYYVAHRHPLWLYQRAIFPMLFMIFTLSVLAAIMLSVPEAFGGFLFLILLDVVFSLLWLQILQFDWENDVMAITSQRMLFQERKLIFYETRQEAPLNAILSVATETTQLGRIFKFGNVVARTYAGAIYLPMVSYPEQVASFLELQWSRAKVYRSKAEAAAMENIIRNRLGYIKTNPGGLPAKPSQPGMKPTLMQGIENWLANLFRLKIETATGTIYRTHWIVLFQRALIPALVFLGVLSLFFIVIFNLLVFPGGPSAGVTLSFLLVIVLSMVGFWLWYQYEDWVNDLYIVNTDQIIDRVKKPFGKEDRKVAPLKNIQSVEFERGGIWGIILDYGSVRILVGEAQMVFHSVFNPSDIQREIFKRMAEREFKEKQTTRENEQKWVIDWIAAYHRVVEQERKTPPNTGFK